MIWGTFSGQFRGFSQANCKRHTMTSNARSVIKPPPRTPQAARSLAFRRMLNGTFRLLTFLTGMSQPLCQPTITTFARYGLATSRFWSTLSR